MRENITNEIKYHLECMILSASTVFTVMRYDIHH